MPPRSFEPAEVLERLKRETIRVSSRLSVVVADAISQARRRWASGGAEGNGAKVLYELIKRGAWAPWTAAAAYASLAVVVAEPRTATRLFPKHDVTNVLLLTSFAGTSVWLWKRPHISGTTPGRRFPWVFLASSTYVLGSVLMWAIIRSAVSHRPVVSMSLVLVTGGALTYSAVDYFNYVDRDFEPIEEVLSEDINHSDDEKYDLDYN